MSEPEIASLMATLVWVYAAGLISIASTLLALAFPIMFTLMFINFPYVEVKK